MGLSVGAGLLLFAMLPVFYVIVLLCGGFFEISLQCTRFLRPYHWLASRLYMFGLGLMGCAFLFRPAPWSFTPDQKFLYWVSRPYHEGAGAWVRSEGLAAKEQYMLVLDNYWRLTANTLTLTLSLLVPVLALALVEFLVLRGLAAALRIAPTPSAFEEFWEGARKAD